MGSERGSIRNCSKTGGKGQEMSVDLGFAWPGRINVRILGVFVIF